MAGYATETAPTMPKNKKPVPRKPAAPQEEDDEVLARQLAALAQAAGTPDADEEMQRQIRNALRKKNDDVLYGAIEEARYADPAAYQLLRDAIEEAAATVLLRREGRPAMEINAFAVPVFVHSMGGLKEGEGFQDGAAHEALVASLHSAGLESKDANVVLVSHAYDLAEIDAISYSALHEIVREVAASMTDKKLAAMPQLERSMPGWQPGSFGPADKAVELRFLVGFALKREDDPFYAVPKNEAKADAYFEARMARYRAWTGEAAPLVARCLAADPVKVELHFLYQDLFYGAKAQGMAELAMLGLISGVNALLAEQGLAGADVRATVSPAAEGDELVLRVSVMAAAGGTALAVFDQPLDVAADLQGAVEEVVEALAGLGVTAEAQL
jgi:hypothetical protein